jgi:hypothetical protein
VVRHKEYLSSFELALRDANLMVVIWLQCVAASIFRLIMPVKTDSGQGSFRALFFCHDVEH